MNNIKKSIDRYNNDHNEISKLNTTTFLLSNTNREIKDLEALINSKTETIDAEIERRIKPLQDQREELIKEDNDTLKTLRALKLEQEDSILEQVPVGKKFQNELGFLYENFKPKDRKTVNTVAIKKLEEGIRTDTIRIIKNVEGAFGITQFVDIDLYKMTPGKSKLKITAPDKDIII